MTREPLMDLIIRRATLADLETVVTLFDGLPPNGNGGTMAAVSTRY